MCPKMHQKTPDAASPWLSSSNEELGDSCSADLTRLVRMVNLRTRLRTWSATAVCMAEPTAPTAGLQTGHTRTQSPAIGQ